MPAYKIPDHLDWVKPCIALGKSQKIVHNRVLKKVVEDECGIYGFGGRWRDWSEHIKDVPMKFGDAFVPVDYHWYYNPPIGILLLWVEATLDRHNREVFRILTALSLPRYRKKVPTRVLNELVKLHDALGEVIKAISDGHHDEEEEEEAA